MTVNADAPLWRPDPERAASSTMAAFFRTVTSRDATAPRADAPYAEWHAWSVREPARFWMGVWKGCGVIGEMGARALVGGERMVPPGSDGSAQWFPDARINFAENLLRRRDDAPAIIAWDESGARREISFRELAAHVGRMARALRAAGVVPGDRVAGFLPNIPEAVVSALAAASIGAMWSSCSPDFGVRGVLDRFGQIEPKVLVVADGYRYAGKRIELAARVEEIASALPSLRVLVTVPFLDGDNGNHDRDENSLHHREHGEHSGSGALRRTDWDPFLRSGGEGEIPFTRLPFDHPLYVMYSSGTTGLPKCMVHGAGGRSCST